VDSVASVAMVIVVDTGAVEVSMAPELLAPIRDHPVNDGPLGTQLPASSPPAARKRCCPANDRFFDMIHNEAEPPAPTP
jgi:hypothetical protein